MTVDDSQAARGSDDEYCSAYPPDGHHYVAHSVDAPPIRWVDRCSLCGRISNRALRRQLADAPSARSLTPQGDENASGVGRDRADDLSGPERHTPDVDYLRGASEALAEVADRIADLDGTEISMRALRQVLEAAAAEIGVGA